MNISAAYSADCCGRSVNEDCVYLCEHGCGLLDEQQNSLCFAYRGHADLSHQGRENSLTKQRPQRFADGGYYGRNHVVDSVT